MLKVQFSNFRNTWDTTRIEFERVTKFGLGARGSLTEAVSADVNIFRIQTRETTVTETSAPEIANLLYWLMVVGYDVGNMEVRFDMERVLGTTPKLVQELPPGENILVLA